MGITISFHHVNLFAVECAVMITLTFNAPAPTQVYTLSLHDALPIFVGCSAAAARRAALPRARRSRVVGRRRGRDRKSTRLNSSHLEISYAVFCLKKKRRRLADRGSVFEVRSR